MARFENVTMSVSAGVFSAQGYGPGNGSEGGPTSFYYLNGTNWIKFAQSQCGAWDHNGPNEIADVRKSGTQPTGSVDVVVSLVKDGIPPNASSSVPVKVNF